MKLSRKAFLKNSVLASVAIGLSKLPSFANSSSPSLINSTKNKATVKDEKYWLKIREEFCTSINIINLNNAAVSPQPIAVQHAQTKYEQYSNEAPSYFMWEKLANKRDTCRENLAEFAGCAADELAFSRNATEALNTLIYGVKIKTGEEVILSNLDYPFVINSWKQRAEREGIRLKFIQLNFPENSEEEIIAKYKAATSEKTKFIQLTHVINWNGQILPVKKLIDLAHSRNCKVILDAAHSFAHLPYKISELNADYFAASLHKWFCGPFGTGFLQMKKEHIADCFPLHSAYDSKSDSIQKFEFIGTNSYTAQLALLDALNFQEAIGVELKYKRLSYLRNYWIEKVSALKNFQMFSPNMEKGHGGSIAAFGIKSLSAKAISSFLMERHNIHTGIVNLPEIEAVRISPHIYTSLQELDILVSAIKKLHKESL